MTVPAVRLGQSDVYVSPMGVGTWAWGDRLVWGYGRGYGEADVEEVLNISLAAGIDFFDTAEVYGSGRSERLLGRGMQALGRRVVVATKFMPFPWRLGRDSLLAALRRSLKRLGVEQVDLYQVHWPLPPVPLATWAEALADAVEAGLTRAVGVSNFSADQMRRVQAVLARRGVPLASNQVEYSLLQRRPEENGLVAACQELGVTLIAYSPLAQGLLTGKYTPENPPPGLRGLRFKRRLGQLPPLIRLLQSIGEAHGGKTPGQVALNWVMAKGAVPIPGAKNGRQARENAGALGWQLTDEEVAALDSVSSTI